jgi:hypothetical protein
MTGLLEAASSRGFPEAHEEFRNQARGVFLLVVAEDSDLLSEVQILG